MNPGMVPDGQILSAGDRTVVFEERYDTYVNMQTAKQLSALPDRNALACLMHSIPEDFSEEQLRVLIGELKDLAGSIFITDLRAEYYQHFSPRFEKFVRAMA
jgi:hypothetical protein